MHKQTKFLPPLILRALLVVWIFLAIFQLNAHASPASAQVPPADPPEEESAEPPLDIFAGPSSADFKLLNPFEMYNSPYKNQFKSPAGIINRTLLFAFPLAGLLLFLMIVWGGLEMVIGATNKKSMDQARQRITSAVIGFGLLFTSYWIVQIVEYIFNLAIL